MAVIVQIGLLDGRGGLLWESPEGEILIEIWCGRWPFWMGFATNSGRFDADGWMVDVEGNEISVLVVGSDGHGGQKVVEFGFIS